MARRAGSPPPAWLEENPNEYRWFDEVDMWPVTEPPATEPPATEPPTTEPPATEPPGGLELTALEILAVRAAFRRWP